MSGPGPTPTVPDPETFLSQAREATVVPVVRTLPSDWWTPVSAFHLLAGRDPHVFLLESVEGGEQVGRYSFLGRRPYLIVTSRKGRVTVEGRDAARHGAPEGDPLAAVERILAAYRVPPPAGLPPFVSGAVGYFGFETVRWVETLPRRDKPEAPEAEMVLLFLEDVLAFDHVRRRLTLVANAVIGEDPARAYAEAVSRLDAMEAELHAPLTPPRSASAPPAPPAPEPASNLTRDAFLDHVRQAKERIAAGEIFQVVLSQRFRVPTSSDDLGLFRALRSINPSPYMFLLRLDGWSAVGSSPEPLLRVTGSHLEVRPIAGTAARSGDPEEDERRAEALRADPKERAEHVMLVDLGRNDLGRCAVSGSVRVETLMEVERYSHVMHLVSGLTGTLQPGRTPLDALFSCFPAGTVSGAPKVRALEIIEELEPDRRGVYAGAVGYVDFSGNLDTCIALRTMLIRDGEVRVQAGAGIVADSDPAREYEETRQKAGALLAAVRAAEGSRGPR